MVIDILVFEIFSKLFSALFIHKNLADDLFLENLASAWTKLANADRFDGPNGNICDKVEGNLFCFKLTLNLLKNFFIFLTFKSFTSYMIFFQSEIAKSVLLNLIQMEVVLACMTKIATIPN